MKKTVGCIITLLLLSYQARTQQPDTVSVYFSFDKADLTEAASSALNQFLQTYKNGAVYTPLELRGHCDAMGSDAYNDDLSNRRVASVLRYLQQQGVPDSVISLSKGYGERVPVSDNQTAEGRQLNRRVEVIWRTPDLSSVPPPANQPKDTIPVLTQETIKTIKEGQTLRLRNINFHGGSHRFLPEAQPALNELLTVMKDNPTLVIEIQGHICCLPGSTDGFDYDASDYNLSYNRARAVYDFLNKNGIDANRMTYRGFAGRVPLVYPEYTEEDRTTNRRVEIKIIQR